MVQELRHGQAASGIDEILSSIFSFKFLYRQQLRIPEQNNKECDGAAQSTKHAKHRHPIRPPLRCTPSSPTSAAPGRIPAAVLGFVSLLDGHLLGDGAQPAAPCSSVGTLLALVLGLIEGLAEATALVVKVFSSAR
ncbi:MAG: hypothetical protein U1E77_14100 [Inhella sp.]